MAGGSAKAEYERRRAKDRERRRRTFKMSLLIVILTPGVVYVFVRAQAAAANEWLLSSLFHDVGISGPTTVVEPKTAHLFGLLFAAIATVRKASDLWGARQTTEAWRKGYEGELMTADVLDRLPPSYVVLHDLKLPRSRANIDHLVVGPTGVFTVETKHYSSDVSIRRGQARHAGRSMDHAVEQANRQADAVREVLGCPVRAVVCVQGGSVIVDGWFARPIVDGVRFCSGGRLVAVLTKLDRELEDADIARLSDTACRTLGRPDASKVTKASTVTEASGPACRCGSEMVIRHRRTDHAPFWGCSRFPACRHTVPIAG